jgi:hypothetical protein
MTGTCAVPVGVAVPVAALAAAGLLFAVLLVTGSVGVCSGVGSAIGALCNPPLQASQGLRLPVQPAAIAVAMVIVTWTLSTAVAARRTGI